MNNKILIIENSQQFHEAYRSLYELSNSDSDIHMVGLDCEYVTKDLHPESYEAANWCAVKNQHKVAAKLQIAAENLCIIVDLCKIGCELPNDLVLILESENWLKFGVGITIDMEVLAYQYKLEKCNGVFDMGIICKYLGCSNPNLEYLYNAFGCSSDKFKKTNDKFVDWSQDMTTSQIKYASGDAYASYGIGKEMMKHTKKSVCVLFDKYNKNNTVPDVPANITTIEIPICKNNYIGAINEYAQKNKTMLPTFDYIKYNDMFICKCDMETSGGIVSFSSEPNANKKNAKHDVCKKIFDNYLSKGMLC